MHAQVTYVYHKTGTMGADDWYKNAFKPFLDGGLHSGEVGGPVTGAAFKTVFDVVVLRGREAENETVAVFFVHPKASTDAIAKFFDEAGLKEELSGKWRARGTLDDNRPTPSTRPTPGLNSSAWLETVGQEEEEFELSVDEGGNLFGRPLRDIDPEDDDSGDLDCR